jgi:DHA1 family bicyclomycin/chloramphenicol resistance-like MFS transporter
VNNKETIIFILLVVLCPLGQVSIDFYSTSLPSIAKSFHIDNNTVGIITTAYLFAYGIGQVIHGILCDILGRKKLLSFMLPLYILATLAPPFCTSIYTIAIARFVQGISIAAVSVSVKAIAADTFKGTKLTKIISLLTVIWGLSPILAPFIGSLIQTFLGWKWCFYILSSISLVFYLCLIFFMPETLLNKKTFKLNYVTTQYGLVLKNSAFWIYMLQVNLAIVGLLTFITQTPELIQNVYRFTSIENGALFILVSFFYVLGAQLSFFEKGKYKTYAMSLIVFLISLLLFLNYWIIIPSIIFIFFSLVIMFICGNLLPRNLAKCIQLFPENSGLVSGLVGFITLITPGALFSITSFMELKAFYRFSVVMLITSAISFVGAYLLKHAITNTKIKK